MELLSPGLCTLTPEGWAKDGPRAPLQGSGFRMRALARSRVTGGPSGLVKARDSPTLARQRSADRGLPWPDLIWCRPSGISGSDGKACNRSWPLLSASMPRLFGCAVKENHVKLRRTLTPGSMGWDRQEVCRILSIFLTIVDFVLMVSLSPSITRAIYECAIG